MWDSVTHACKSCLCPYQERKEGSAAVALFPTREIAKATRTLLRALTYNSGFHVLVAIAGEHSAKRLAAMTSTGKPHISLAPRHLKPLLCISMVQFMPASRDEMWPTTRKYDLVKPRRDNLHGVLHCSSICVD